MSEPQSFPAMSCSRWPSAANAARRSSRCAASWTSDAGERLAELRDAGEATLLDLDELTFMDSTGIRLVLTACEDAQKQSWSFRVTRGSERVRQVLAAAQVIDRLPYDDDRGAG